MNYALVMKQMASSLVDYIKLPRAARRERRLDSRGLSQIDPGAEATLAECTYWLCRAQDFSASRDGGFARHYSLIDGWSTSYPETTGYIIPTLIECAKFLNDQGLRLRAKRALDWLLSIQSPNGSFQGGRIGLHPVVPVIFNTGQILLGLASGVSEFGDRYLEPLRRAALWLVQAQDPDGAWRKHYSPFASRGEKSYDTHVSWGLLEAARVDPDQRYVDAAFANVRWALTQQAANGWFGMCCFDHHDATPLTHTIGYALRGVLEAYKYSRDGSLLEAAQRTAESLLSVMERDGFIPARLNRNWQGPRTSACLTGTAQIAICFLLFYEFTGDSRYCDAAFAANRYVRRSVRLTGPPEIRGAVKGSFPIHAEYCRYEYINWANKFLIDSTLLELKVRGRCLVAQPMDTVASEHN